MRAWRAVRPPSATRAFVVAAATLLAACGHVLPPPFTGTDAPFDFAHHTCHPDQHHEADKVEVRTLGSGGVLIRWRGESLLLGASYSNPNPLRAYVWRGRTNEGAIDHALGDVKDVVAIFAGHAHYDHIGDLPAVAKRFPKAKVYLNASGVNIVGGEELNVQMPPLASGQTIRIDHTFRVTTVASGHAPQLCRWTHFPCTYATDAVKTKRTVPMRRQRLRTMRGGDTLAFAIELLGEDSRSRYRIYYNDASPSSPLGQIAGPFDLAILTMAQWKWVNQYPRDLLHVLQPKHVLVSHWDYFFRPTTENATFVPRLDAPGFLRIVNEIVAEGDAKPTNDVCGVTTKRYTMAVPGASLFFKPN